MPWVEKRREIAPDAPEPGARIDHVVQQMSGLPRRQVRSLFQHGLVRLNGQPCALDATRLEPGDVVELRYDPAQRYKEMPPAWRDSRFSVVFEDEHLMVVEKAAHALTVPTGEAPADTLLEAIREYLARGGRRAKPYVVHRLDRGTSGLLVFAKSPAAMEALKQQFAEHKPERRYLALVVGGLDKASGTFRSYLATAANLDRYSTADQKKGQLAVTHYQVVQALSGIPGATLVSVRLETGRRNQIRVHFAEAGHPVLGDPRYRPDLARHPRWRAKRLALHAAALGFRHPITGQDHRFESPMPAEMARFVRATGRGARRAAK